MLHQIIAVTYNNKFVTVPILNNINNINNSMYSIYTFFVDFVVSVGLIWDSESPDAEHIADVLQCIGTTLKLSDVRLKTFVKGFALKL